MSIPDPVFGLIMLPSLGHGGPLQKGHFSLNTTAFPRDSTRRADNDNDPGTAGSFFC